MIWRVVSNSLNSGMAISRIASSLFNRSAVSPCFSAVTASSDFPELPAPSYFLQLW